MIQGTDESQPQQDRIQQARIILDDTIVLYHKITETFLGITYRHGQGMETMQEINQEVIINQHNHLREKDQL